MQAEVGCPITDSPGEDYLRAREAGSHDFWASRFKPSMHVAEEEARERGTWEPRFGNRRGCLELKEELWTRPGGLDQWSLPFSENPASYYGGSMRTSFPTRSPVHSRHAINIPGVEFNQCHKTTFPHELLV